MRRALALVALVFLACGGDDAASSSGGPDGGTPPPGTPPPGVTPPGTPPPGATPPGTPPPPPSGGCGAVGDACCVVSTATCNDGATCSAGHCVASTVAKASTFLSTPVRDLVVAGGYAYYVQAMLGVARRPLTGTVSSQVDISNTIVHLAGVDATSAYIFDQQAWLKQGVSGSGSTSLAGGLDVILYGMHVDDTHLYFSSIPKSGSTTFSFGRIPTAGGPFESIASARVDGIDTDATGIYVRTYDGAITRYDRSTKAATPLVTGVGLGRGFATTASELLYAEGVGSGSTATGRVRRVAKTGGSPVDVGAIARLPNWLATDGTKAYVAIAGTKTDSGAIFAITIADGTTKTIADNLQSPENLAIAGGNLYFIDVVATDGSIRTTPLP